MQPSADDVRAIERLHVRAWPALETAVIGGWLWRYSGGGSQRANSVSTVQFSGDDPTAARDEGEARYRARGAPTRLHTYDLTAPHGLADLLQGRGYGEGETTTTLMKPVTARDLPAGIEIADQGDAAWRDIYLGAITESRRATNAKILGAIPQPCAWFSCWRDGRSRPACASPTATSQWSNAWQRAPMPGGKAAPRRCSPASRRGPRRAASAPWRCRWSRPIRRQWRSMAASALPRLRPIASGSRIEKIMWDWK
jgi:hypothetical protein